MQKIAKTNFKSVNLRNVSRVDTISPPSVFVGSKLKYPNVNVGILSPIEKEENAWMFDAPGYWAEEDFQVGEVVKLRDNLLDFGFVKQPSKDNSLYFAVELEKFFFADSYY